MAKFNPSEHMTDLKGKAYLEVKWRLVWFREDKPSWSIATEMLKLNLEGTAEQQFALFRAVIADENGMVKATAHGSETRKDFNDFIEKAEAKAVGRALAYLGFGTQFAPELEEGQRIVDAPVERRKAEAPRAEAVVDAAPKPFTLQEAMDTVPFTKGPKTGIKMGLLDRGDLEWITGSKASPTLRAKAAAVLAARDGASADAPDDEPMAEEPPDSYMGFDKKKPVN